MRDDRDTLTIARRLAAEHPGARLPCPACAVSVNAGNLDRHLAGVHPGFAAAAPPWRGTGFFPVSLTFTDDALVLRHRLGLSRRAVALPCRLEVGPLVAWRLDPVMSSYADDTNVAGEHVRAGRYLRLVGEAAITIGCRQATQFHAHWDRAQLHDGAPRRRCDLILPRVALVALEYELARRNLLVPAAPR
jgi:hypothetical protein